MLRCLAQLDDCRVLALALGILLVAATAVSVAAADVTPQFECNWYMFSAWMRCA